MGGIVIKIKGFKFIKLDSRTLFLFTFLITISLFNNGLDKLERHFYGVKVGVTVDTYNAEGLLPDEVRLVVEELAVKYQTLPVEPSIDRVTGEIIPEQEGVVVDIEKSVSKILSAQENEKVSLYFIKVPPVHSSEELKNLNKVLGYYETGIAGSYQRHNNIKLASQGINNVLLWPGEVFSFNEIVGPRTVERGYLPAPVILMGSTSLDYGGGVCQVSSTLYNAVLNTKLKVIERHPHTKPVYYVPKGKDATVSYGGADFKFKNVLDEPVLIKSGVSGGKIWVQIRGRS
ncbi:MAG: VanW family protein [Syntrophomonadaceae bacterium]|nr:VanW family protein [Syntrophomonadaceae bacterium]